MINSDANDKYFNSLLDNILSIANTSQISTQKGSTLDPLPKSRSKFSASFCNEKKKYIGKLDEKHVFQSKLFAEMNGSHNFFEHLMNLKSLPNQIKKLDNELNGNHTQAANTHKQFFGQICGCLSQFQNTSRSQQKSSDLSKILSPSSKFETPINKNYFSNRFSSQGSFVNDIHQRNKSSIIFNATPFNQTSKTPKVNISTVNRHPINNENESSKINHNNSNHTNSNSNNTPITKINLELINDNISQAHSPTQFPQTPNNKQIQGINFSNRSGNYNTQIPSSFKQRWSKQQTSLSTLNEFQEEKENVDSPQVSPFGMKFSKEIFNKNPLNSKKNSQMINIDLEEKNEGSSSPRAEARKSKLSRMLKQRFSICDSPLSLKSKQQQQYLQQKYQTNKEEQYKILMITTLLINLKENFQFFLKLKKQKKTIQALSKILGFTDNIKEIILEDDGKRIRKQFDFNIGFVKEACKLFDSKLNKLNLDTIKKISINTSAGPKIIPLEEGWQMYQIFQYFNQNLYSYIEDKTLAQEQQKKIGMDKYIKDIQEKKYQQQNKPSYKLKNIQQEQNILDSNMQLIFDQSLRFQKEQIIKRLTKQENTKGSFPFISQLSRLQSASLDKEQQMLRSQL